VQAGKTRIDHFPTVQVVRKVNSLTGHTRKSTPTDETLFYMFYDVFVAGCKNPLAAIRFVPVFIWRVETVLVLSSGQPTVEGYR